MKLLLICLLLGCAWLADANDCPMLNTIWLQHQIRGGAALTTSWQQCALKCSVRADCHAWSWHTAQFVPVHRVRMRMRNKCMLKTANYARGRRTKANVISGTMACIAGTMTGTNTEMQKTKVSICVERNTDYAGNDVRVINDSRTWQNCKRHCKVVSRCKYWSDQNSGTCWLKTSDVGRKFATGMVGKWEIPFYSGPKDCEGEISILYVWNTPPHQNNKKLWGAQHAVRGNPLKSSTGFYQSMEYFNPWIKMRLAKPVVLTSITIINRLDCCGERLRDVYVHAGMHVCDRKNIGFYKGPGLTGGWALIRMKYRVHAQIFIIEIKDKEKGREAKEILQINGLLFNRFPALT